MSLLTQLKTELKWIYSELFCLNKIALAAVPSVLFSAIQLKTGTIFLARASGEDISAMVSDLFLGQTVIGTTYISFSQGLFTGMNALCSQAHGAGNHKLVGVYYMRAMFIASLSFFPLWTIWLSVSPAVMFLSGDRLLADGAGSYTSLFCLTYPANVYWRLTSGVLQSQNIILATFLIALGFTISTVALQYMFAVILLEGISGIMLAYVVSSNLFALCTFAYVRLTNIHLKNFGSWSTLYLNGWYHFLKYGAVCVMQFVIDISAVRIVPIIVIGFIIQDKDQFAVIGILNTVWYLSLSLSLGYGISASIRISHLLGERNLSGAKKSTVFAVLLIYMLHLVMGILVFSLASPLSYLFTSFERMRDQVEFGFKILGLCIFLETYSSIRNILTACCLQFHSILIQFIIIVMISTPIGVVLSFYVAWRAVVFTLVVSVGHSISALVLILILYCYNWDNILNKVLENSSLRNQNADQDSSDDSKDISLSKRTKIFVVLRYLVVLTIGVSIFTITCIVIFN